MTVDRVEELGVSRVEGPADSAPRKVHTVHSAMHYKALLHHTPSPSVRTEVDVEARVERGVGGVKEVEVLGPVSISGSSVVCKIECSIRNKH